MSSSQQVSSTVSAGGLPEHVLRIRQDWAESLRLVRAQHDSGASGRAVVGAISTRLEQLVSDLYRVGLSQAADTQLGQRTALILHGGCGRRHVAPFSDVDLMLMCESADGTGVAELARLLSQSLNDAGFKLGFSVQTPKQAQALALRDPATFSSLVDGRLLAGGAPLYDQFFQQFRRTAQKRSAALIRSVVRAREVERTQFGDTVYLLRPDIKRSRGGLRDIHLVRWIGFLRFGMIEFDELIEAQAMLASDGQRLDDAVEFLLRLRNEMHFAAQGPNDRLARAEQVRIAETFGYEGTEAVLPVERFMRDYFRHTSNVRFASDHFVAACQARAAMPNMLTSIITRSVDKHFRVGLFQIGAKPTALTEVAGSLELVLRLMQLSNLYDKEIEYATWESIRQSMTDCEELPLSPNEAARFMALLSGPTRLSTLLHRLHDLRALEKIVPGFAHARSLLQFNEYHQYTVDEHTIQAVQAATEFNGRSDTLGQAYREIRAKDLLHLALLLHDLGKGFKEDHSEVGRRLAEETVQRLGLPKEDGDTVVFLVHKHLLMDHLATRRDINDETTVAEFAAQAGSIQTLQMLYVLTCADIAGVGPGTLTDWKLGLLTDLYRNAQSFLTGHHGPRAVDPKLGKFFDQIPKLVPDPELSQWVIERARALPRNYCGDHTPETITSQVLDLRDLGPEEFKCWINFNERRKTMELCIGKHQQRLAGIFYQMNGMLASLGLRISAADIKPLDDALVWYWFQFEDPTFSGVPPKSRQDEILQQAIELVSGARPSAPRFPRTWQFASSDPTEYVLPDIRVQIDNQSAEHATIVDVFAYQKLGILYTISKRIYEFGLDVHFARTSVYGSRMVCVFYITDETRSKVRDLRQLVKIRRGLLETTKAFLTGKAPGQAD
jgi:[protein-PII] uridylyltransferase